MTDFTIVVDHTAQPRRIYDGGDETTRVNVRFLALNLTDRKLVIDLSAPETRCWRRYYTPEELQVLREELGCDEHFLFQRHTSTDSTRGLAIRIQPMHRFGAEFSLCFLADEPSLGHRVVWLVAVLQRSMTRGDFHDRLRKITDAPGSAEEQ